MKVAELEGAQLDYWVARAEGVKWPAIHEHKGVPDWCAIGGNPGRRYTPSANWVQGGLIIDRERIATFPAGELGWAAFIQGPNCHYVDTTAYDEMRGPTPLTAAMRAYVASKFGDAVPDQVE
jgi:hypothetical protein